jgi:hypothetical protein
MRRLGFLAALLALAGVTLGSASAHTDQARRSICHRTGVGPKPYVLLKVTAAQLAAHLKHPSDIVPAPKGGCPTTLLVSNGGTAFQVSLTGETESPPGDPVGTGTATVRLRVGQGQACYQIDAKNLTGIAAAHIHAGAAGAAGPVVVPLATPNESGQAKGCVAVARSLVAKMLGQPANYYVNVHTGEFPAGAIRGQLTGTSESASGTVIALVLKGTSEPEAKGSAVLRFCKDAGLVCYRLHAESVTLPTTAAHIHKGAAGTNGPVVVPFTAPGANGDSSGCATAPASLIDDILTSPSGFYVNVHTKEHPAGAIRAQLG